jgi:hypothetical protein
MQPWPNPNQAAKERSSERTPDLRSRLKLNGAGSGVKGQDERQTTAPLTPPTSLEMSIGDPVENAATRTKQTENKFSKITD